MEESSSAVGSLRSCTSGRRHLPQSPDRRRTTHEQFPTIGGDRALMSIRDDKDSGYVGSTSSRQAALLQPSRHERTSGISGAQGAITRRCALR